MSTGSVIPIDRVTRDFILQIFLNCMKGSGAFCVRLMQNNPEPVDITYMYLFVVICVYVSNRTRMKQKLCFISHVYTTSQTF